MASFEKGMGILAERFRSPMHADAQKGYYAILSDELTTEEFRVAVRLAFRHSQFWPSPQQLIDFARPPRDLNSEALEMFERVRSLGFIPEGTAVGRCWRREDVAGLGPAALAAFSAIGAQERLRNLAADDLPFCRREFIAVYKSKAARDQQQLQVESIEQTMSLPARPRAIRASAAAEIIRDVLSRAGPA